MAISSTTMRLTGLASNLDTDSIIKTLMQIEQLKVDRQVRALKTYEWKQESLNTVKSDLTSFQNTWISMTSSSSMMRSGNYISYNVGITGGTSNAVTISANSEAAAGSFVINSISQLAEAATVKSSSAVSNGSGLSEGNYAQLKDLDFANDLGFVNGKISFSINGETFTFSETDTLQNMMDTINSSDAGVSMSYSRLTDRITFSTKESGADQQIEIVNITGNAFGDNSAFGIGTGIVDVGQNAILEVDGVTVEKSSNTFTADGIKFTLNSVTDPDDGEIKVSLTQDIDAVVDNVKKFIEGYNTLISKLDSLISERKTSTERTYTALTDEEKESMTEEQIASWEEIAKKGLLYSDSAIRGLLSELRGALFDSVESAGLSPAEIGLTTGATSDWTLKGQITLDEDRLRAAIAADPQKVMNVFIAASDSADKSTAYKENGLISRINSAISNYVKGSGANSLESVEKSIKSASDKVTQMQEKMEELEERYYLKFAAMEEALSQLNSQSDYITSLFSSLSS